MTVLMKIVTLLGEGGIIWIMIGLLLLVRKQTRRTGVTVLPALVFCLGFCNGVLKHVVARPRPCWRNPDLSMTGWIPKDFSFPSGHTASSFAAAACIFFRSRRGGTAALCLAALIAASRMYFYFHYPTDILAGIVLGVLLAVLAERFMVFLEKRGIQNGRNGGYDGEGYKR